MHQTFEKKGVTKKNENYADWYIDVITKSGMADYTPVRGCIVYRPLAYNIWDNIKIVMDAMLKKNGIENCYFPLFIPETLLKKEASHIEGFAPEIAVVTRGGGEELEEKLVVRPTSETIMYTMYSKWIQSHRDLPLKLNQWNNVVRWEKRTMFFIRGTEFLWQEAHTAHATHEECWQQVLDALDIYTHIYEDLMAIPVIKGIKSQTEKFAGAVNTTTCETIMPEGKVLQACTSHDLGQNFAKAFEITFQDKKGETQYVHQTSFGFSTRSLGGLVMLHGDDQGLVLPPRIAPTQVIIIPITQESQILKTAENIKLALEEKHIRAKLDLRQEYSLGYKRNEYELQGIPVRLEIGQKELETNMISVSIRHNNQKEQTPQETLGAYMQNLLNTIHNDMFAKAKAIQQSLTSVANTYEEFKHIMDTKKGCIFAHWCENAHCEAKIKEETKAKTSCLPFDAVQEKGTCILCGKPSKYKWIFAQSY